MQGLTCKHINRVLRETESPKSELSYQVQELERRRMMLDCEAARNEIDRIIFEDERKKEEKKEASNKIHLLEKQLDHKPKMQLEIQKLRSKIQVSKHMGGEEDAALKKKVGEMEEELEEKVEEMECLEELNQTLIVKERKTNDELQEAQKEIIMELKEIRKTNHTHIGVKIMGEVDIKACKKKFSAREALIKAVEYRSKYQDELRKPD